MRRLLEMLCVCAVLATGCSAYDPFYYDGVFLGSYWYAYDAALAQVWVESMPSGSAEPESIATGIAAASDGAFSPPGCANITAVGRTVRYTFSGCNGPQLLTSLEGDLSVAVVDKGGRVVLEARSNDLQVDGSRFVVESVMTVSDLGGKRQAAILSHSFEPELVDSREVQLTVDWTPGSACFEINGQGTASRAAMSATHTAVGYQRCAQACPPAGTITVTGPDGDFVGNFDGSSTLRVINPKGKTGTYEIDCD